ncbi:MAG: hypothetical protein ACTHK8_22150 [Ginsengibacter sp.]
MSILLFLLLFCFACDKEAIKPNTPANYFPNAVGDTWEYDVTDSAQYVQGSNNTVSHYSVQVLIIGTKKLVDGKSASIWKYNYPWGNDTNYVRIVDDTIKIFDNSYNSHTVEGLEYPKLIFVQPLKVNESWNGRHLWFDTLSVVNQKDVTTSFQTFKDCFQIYNHYIGPNMEFKDNYWFKPRVGMVRIYTNRYNLGPLMYRTWQLKNYTVH